ncbi:MAG: MBL fold metallo-hydrolase [Piscirickettsiaceae bacterium]|nr:MAG: MBL fold metallo-hydrolase [Piscirickettsiaceae bacterium]
MSILKYEDIGHGVSCVDSQYIRPGLASCYLIEQNGHAAFIDVGTNYTTPLLLDLLQEKNIPIENVDYVIPTHVHLDHAGGAGSMMQHATNAQLIIHPRGARHMIDPSRLQAGASAVYGETEFKKHYGDLVAIDEQRVTIADDGFSINFQGRVLKFIDTPGHAKHHFCIIDEDSNGIFTGDTFGVAYPELTVNGQPFIFPPSSPVDFNPQDWLNSIDKILAAGCNRAYLTHFNKVDNLNQLASALRTRVKLFADFALRAPNTEELKSQINDYFIAEVLATGCQLSPQEITDILCLDIDLITQGLMVWVEKNA